MKKQCMKHQRISGFLLKALLFAITGTIAVTTPVLAQKCGSTKEQPEQTMCKKKLADIVWNSNLDELKTLVEKDKTIVNQKLDNDETPLTAASYKGDVEMIKYLLAQGAEVESKNKWNNNALSNAAINGNAEIGKLLIDKGANIEMRGSSSYTPLQQALAHNNVEFALMLINKGADVKAVDNNGNSVIYIASWYSNPKVLKAIVDRGGDVNTVKDNYSVLHNACSNDNLESIEFLVQKGADVNLLNGEGNTPLQMVAANQISDAVKLLAKRTTSLNHKDKYTGNTALHLAAVNGDIQSARYLIEAGADMNVANNYGLKPSAYASKFGYVKLAEYFASINPEFSNIVNLAKMKAAAAKESPNLNEMKIYYMGHSGWAIQFKDKVVIIDFWRPGKSTDAGFANGNINTAELQGKKVYVFASHDHSDHYDTTIFSWKKQIKDIQYIYGFRPEKTWDNRERAYKGPAYVYIDNNQTAMIDDIKITTIKSNDSGQGFLIEVNGFKILHPGDHALFNADLAADYKKEIDFIAQQTRNVDVAFLPVTGCPSSWEKEHIVQGFFYVIDKLNPTEVFPMHAFKREYLLKEFADMAKERKCASKIACAENKGDYYVYSKPVTASK